MRAVLGLEKHICNKGRHVKGNVSVPGAETWKRGQKEESLIKPWEEATSSIKNCL